MARTGMLIGGAAVAVAALGASLWWFVRTPAAIHVAEPTTPDVRAPDSPPREELVRRRDPGPGSARDVAPPSTGVRETVIDGVRIRDHRGDAAEVDDLPPALHRPSGPRLPASLTHEVSTRILAAIAPCADAVPREARGDKPRIDGVVDVAIADGQLAINKASIKLREIVGAAVAPTEQCMIDAIRGLRVATNEPDVTSYALNLRYAFP